MKHLLFLLFFLPSLALGANQTLSTRLNVGVANIVVPGTSAGLVASTGLPGSTSSSAFPSGTIGQVYSISRPYSQNTQLTSGTAINLTDYGSSASSVTPAAGWYLVMSSAVYSLSTTTSVTQFNLAVSTSSASFPSSDDLANPVSGQVRTANTVPAFVNGSGAYSVNNPTFVAYYNGSTNVYFVVAATFTASTLFVSGSMYLYRIF